MLIANVIAATIAILVFGLATSDAKTSQPSPFLSPTGALTPRAWLPIVMNNFPPAPTTSYYVKSYDLTSMSNLGCAQGSPFQYPGPTRSWAQGYGSTFVYPSFYFNFGSCDGCPITPCPTCVLTQTWTIADVWYVSISGAAYPLPEIYNATNATQWYQMSLYSFTNHNYPLFFKGALTDYGACQQRGGCAGSDNTPSAGYSELYSAINADPKTAQSLPWSTDIQWQGEPRKYPNP